MLFRSSVTSIALLVCAELVLAGCVNEDPVEEGEPTPEPTVTMPAASSGEMPTQPSEDTTLCGGTFEMSGGVKVSDNCTNAAPVNCNIVSFAPGTYSLGTDTTNWKDDTWDDGMSLTGGVHMYTGEGGTPLVRELVEDALHVTGTVPAGNFAGWLFWFGPCQDAHEFDGVQFTVSGEVPGGSLVVQVQTDENYPIDSANSKGACSYTDEDTKWDVCKNNSFTVEGLSIDNGFSYYVPWEEFTGGLPATEVSENQILGIQFQADCGEEADCVVDVRLHDLRFYRAHDAVLAPPAP
jgi:hypothetical protein